MEINLIQGDCLQIMKSLPACSVDLLFTDPPYALGSDVIIRADGKPDYSKAVDFMSKWKQPDGAFWESWFVEAMRILKHGGRVIMFGMDRQIWFNGYYANYAGFTQQQSLYWYFISNFPKASDLSKNLDKHAGAEREVVGRGKYANRRINASGGELDNCYGSYDIGGIETSPSSPLAQKYEGFKYSISPLKQTCETIMVFQKPYKTGSCLHDVLAYENGDESITCGALDIEGNRSVPLHQLLPIF